MYGTYIPYAIQHNCRQEAVNTELSGQVTTLREKVGRLKVHIYVTCVFVEVFIDTHYNLKALLKLATVKANDRATIPTNVEGNLSLDC